MMKATLAALKRLLGNRSRSARASGAGAPADVGLAGIPRGATVLTDVSTPHGRIDFVIETDQAVVVLVRRRPAAENVAFQGQFLLIDGDSPGEDIIEETLRQSAWLHEMVAQRLKRQIHVVPVVIFASGTIQRTAANDTSVRGVRVITAAEWPRFLKSVAAHEAPRPAPANRKLGRFQPRFLK